MWDSNLNILPSVLRNQIAHRFETAKEVVSQDLENNLKLLAKSMIHANESLSHVYGSGWIGYKNEQNMNTHYWNLVPYVIENLGIV